MKNLIIFAAFAFAVAGCGQKQHTANATVYMFPYADSSFSWKKYEKQDSIVKQQFLANHPLSFNNAYEMYFADPDDLSGNFKNITNDMHIIDVDNDGFDDIVFEGHSGAEPTMTAIYLQNLQGFTQVLKGYQTVKRLDFNGNKPSAVYIIDPGCCADYIETYKIFEAVYVEGKLSFKQVHYTANYGSTKMPKDYLKQPKAFTILTDSAKLRDRPAVANRDTLYLAGEYHFGNDVGSIGKGSKGRAIAKTTDSAGTTWWFVELQPNAVVSGNVFYEKENKHKAGKMGWINEQDLKITKLKL